MSDINRRLQKGAAVLTQLEQRRRETHSPRWGYDAEYLIVSEELRQLEIDIMADPGELACHLVRLQPNHPVDGGGNALPPDWLRDVG